jgi:hypothetical protein
MKIKFNTSEYKGLRTGLLYNVILYAHISLSHDD